MLATPARFWSGKGSNSHLTFNRDALPIKLPPHMFAVLERLSVSLFSICLFNVSEPMSNRLQRSTTLCKLNHFRRNAIRFLKFFKETADTLNGVTNHLFRHLRIDRQR